MRSTFVLALILMTTIAASAQTVTPSSPTVERHQALTLTVAGMSCTAGQAYALLGDTRTIAAEQPSPPAAAPATKDAKEVKDTSATWTVATGALPAGAHTIRIKCGDVTSMPATVQVTAARPTVLSVTNLTPKDDDTSTVRMGDTVAVEMRGFADWEAAHRDPTTRQAPPLHLFLDGIELSNLTFMHPESDPDKDLDTFTTSLTFDPAATRTSWVQALWSAQRHAHNAVDITVGGAGGPAFVSNATIKVNLYRSSFFYFSVVLLFALLTVTLLIAVNTAALRDGSENSPFSLARHQMAVWFVIVVGAYLFVTATTGSSAAVSPTALVLIGISGATGLMAVTIDKSKRNTPELQALETERAAVTEALNSTGGLREKLKGSPDEKTLRDEVAAKEKRLAEIDAKLHPKSQGWWVDLLSDGDGISFHRLQMATWTFVFAGVFVRAVWRDLAMPEFDATTLGLMGISSGTYLGFKLPERQ